MFTYELSEIISVFMCVIVFYVLAIRPGREIEKRRYQAVQKINSGDVVILQSGLIGKVTKREDVIFYVKLAEGFTVQVLEDGIKDIVDITKINKVDNIDDKKIEDVKKLSLDDDGTALPSAISQEKEVNVIEEK